MKRRTSLIIGCGYLGTRVGKLLADSGDRVFGTTRTSARMPELAGLGIEGVMADVLDPATLDRLPQADRVLYCVGFDRALGVPIATVYVDGLRHALGRLADRVGSLVYASSTGVYGGGDGDWVNEDSPAEPMTESGRACLAAEAVVREYEAEAGLRATILRYSGLYGPGRIMRREALIRGDEIVGDPDRFLNLIQIDDAAMVAVAAMDAGRGQALYLVSDDRPGPRIEFYARAAEVLGGPPPRFRMPEPGSPESKREGSNKRVSNARMKAELGVILNYPDITTGVPASLGDA